MKRPLLDPDYISQLAREEFAREQHRIAVDTEVARLRSRSNRSFWQRFLEALPFTITWKKS